MAIAGFRRYQNGKKGGGDVFWCMYLRSARRLDLEDEGIEALWIKVKTRKRWVLLCNMYRPPGAAIAWIGQQWLKRQSRRRSLWL